LFRKKGLNNPVQDIISELMKHTELIPYEAKPGGTAGFYDKETWVLNEKWVWHLFQMDIGLVIYYLNMLLLKVVI
jgi:hypothetical protein